MIGRRSFQHYLVLLKLVVRGQFKRNQKGFQHYLVLLKRNRGDSKRTPCSWSFQHYLVLLKPIKLCRLINDCKHLSTLFSSSQTNPYYRLMSRDPRHFQHYLVLLKLSLFILVFNNQKCLFQHYLVLLKHRVDVENLEAPNLTFNTI